MKFKYLFFALLIFVSQLSFAQLYSFSVNLNGKISPQMISSFQKNVTFIAIDDLMDIVEAAHSFNSETLQEEISIVEGKIFLTAYNPFIFFVSADGKKYSYQMLQPTEFRYGKIFVPLKSFSEFLNKYTNLKIESNENSFLISVKYDKSKKNFISITQENKQSPSSIKETEKRLPNPQNTNSLINPARQNFDLFDFSIEEKANGYIFRIKSKKEIKSVSKNLSGKFLYLRIPESTINIERFNSQLESGIISEVSAIQNGNNADIKLTLRDKIESHEIVREKKTNDILLLLHVSTSVMNKLKEEIKKKGITTKKENLLDVIVIDAGHGGMDPGAIGYRGTKEKDVNLGIALKLGRLIEKNHSNIKVIYTRKDDSFVELYRRGQIANENNGKLFISIHCNSTDERPGTRKGSEVYLLRPGKTEDAIRIAEKENSVIKFEEGYKERYKFLSDENFILTAMASTANVKHSEKFASIISEKFEKLLPLKNNGVKQAGFYVLVGASMPSVLIETGYINNPEDEMFLRSESGQQKIAEAIYSSILEFKNYFDQLVSK
jgi:N-acetylmuramoyl-L-alanine amidase